MKKTLLALAAIAASSAAFAQSSVSLYGVVDASLESVKGDKTLTRVTSDNLASSRFGLRGTEDLGSGLKANFVLEATVKPDTGAADSTRFFGRQAWVGVQGGFGEVRLGRTDTSIGALAGNTNILGGQDYDDFKIAGTFSGNTYRRTDNAITYVLPKLVDGLSAQVQYSTAVGTSAVTGTENDDRIGSQYGLSAQYNSNTFLGGLGYIHAKRTATVDDTAVLAYLGYNFGAFKLTGYYEQDKADGAAEKLKLYGGRVDVPLGKDFSLQVSYSQVKDATKAANVDDDASILALKGTYNLSKRTSLYGLVTTVSNDDGVALKVGSSAPALSVGERSSGFAVGVIHKF